jgi:hypothetical protein
MVNSAMNPTLPNAERLRHLTNVDRPSPAKADLLTARERAARIVRQAIARSGHLPKEIADKDHGQFSRECDGKEKLSFHEMVAEWPADVWRELLPLIALEVCPGKFEVERAITIKEKSA